MLKQRKFLCGYFYVAFPFSLCSLDWGCADCLINSLILVFVKQPG